MFGLNPRRDRDELRRVLGVQLQDSELPPKLEVGEALELYASSYPDPEDPGAALSLDEAVAWLRRARGSRKRPARGPSLRSR